MLFLTEKANGGCTGVTKSIIRSYEGNTGIANGIIRSAVLNAGNGTKGQSLTFRLHH